MTSEELEAAVLEYLERRQSDPALTPESFAAAYPGSAGPLLEAIGKHMWAPHRKSREEKAREEVRDALAEVLACRADPSRPGC